MTPVDAIKVLDWAEKNGTWAFYFGKMQHPWNGSEQELELIRECARGKSNNREPDEERGQRFLDFWVDNYQDVPQAPGDVMVLCCLEYQKKANKHSEPRRKGDNGSNWGGER